MNLELAQLISIVSYGNSYLNSTTEKAPPELSQNQSTFYCVSCVEFVMRNGPKDVPKDVPISKGTLGWFQHLKDNGVKRLHLINVDWSQERPGLPDRCAAFFLGSGNWAILTNGYDGQFVWLPEWKVLKRPKKDGKDSSVMYRGVRLDDEVPTPKETVAGAENALRKALEDIRDFASTELKGMQWHKCFQMALDILDQDEPDLKNFGDMVPDSLALKAKRLIMASEQAWVFGGMGSWNDVGLDGDPVYTKVSNALYKAVCNALGTAATAI